MRTVFIGNTEPAGEFSFIYTSYVLLLHGSYEGLCLTYCVCGQHWASVLLYADLRALSTAELIKQKGTFESNQPFKIKVLIQIYSSTLILRLIQYNYI